MKKLNNASFIVVMFALGVLFGVIFWIGGHVSAAPIGDEYPPDRIPFTNKPVTPGDPESYIGTYGQCPFYENAMEKGCFPPNDIECNADWSYCAPRTASVSQPQPANDTNTQPPAQNAPTPSKTGNSGYSGAGSSTTYAPPVANEPTDVNETVNSVDVANADVNETPETVSVTEKIKNPEPRDYSFEVLIGGLSVVIIGFGAWYWYTQHYRKK